MPFIGTQPEVGGYSVLDTLTASATASYTLQKDSANFTPSSANQLLVSLNGVIQKPGSSFTVSGSTLTFSSALTSFDSIDFIIAMGEPLLIGTPSDGTVSTSKIADDAVTGAKIENNPQIAGNLTVSGTATLAGNSTVGGSFGVTGASTLTGAASLNGGVTVSSGTVNMSSSLLQFSGNIALPNVGACLFRPAADTIAFGINNGQRVSVNQHGLLFGTDTAAANALDDYEEGTWTPIITGYSGGNTQTYQYQTGNYVKVGKVVTCTYQVRLSAKGNISGNYVHLKGMPFANLGTLAGSGIIHYVWSINTSRDNIAWEFGGGNTDRCWLTYLDGTTTAYSTTSDITNTTGFMGTLIYYTDS